MEARSAAAEKLFNKCAEDENARQRAGLLGVVVPLVRLARVQQGTAGLQSAQPNSQRALCVAMLLMT